MVLPTVCPPLSTMDVGRWEVSCVLRVIVGTRTSESNVDLSLLSENDGRTNLLTPCLPSGRLVKNLRSRLRL